MRTLSLFFLMWLSSALSADAGTWQVLPPTPTARTEVAVVAHGGKIYVIGGFTPQGITARVEVYDPATRAWSEAAALPQALHHTTAASVNGRIYVIGGFTGGLWTPENLTFEYDPARNSWTEKTPMPSKRGALAIGVIRGRIHAVGGAHKKFLRLVNTGAHEVYDPATDHWETLAPLPTPRDHLTVAVHGGRLHAIGGRVNVNYNHNLDAHEAYDPASGGWQSLPPLPTARSGITAQELNGAIYVFGGESGDGTFNQNEVYVAAEDRWQTREPMPHSVHGLGSAVMDGRIHLITGGPHPGGGGSRLHQVYDPR